MNIIIRRWLIDDAKVVFTILHETWIASYASFISQNDILGYLQSHYAPAALESMITGSYDAGYIAEADGSAVAYLRLHENSDENKLYVSQLYVMPRYQKLGLGRKLMHAAADYARDMGFDRLWVGVMVQNISSVQWYKKLGYIIETTEPFTMGTTTVDHYIGFLETAKLLTTTIDGDEDTVPQEKLFARYDSPSGPSATELVAHLHEQQYAAWQQFHDNADAFNDVLVKKLSFKSCNTFVQFNHARFASTSAKVDPVSLGQRPCFLCIGQLPQEQLCLLWHKSLMILCNPAPIFERHFTVVSLRHALQAIEPHIMEMLELARDVAPGYTVFYNGPRCGASAPDHFHFQMSPRRAMPAENDAVEMKRRNSFYYKDHVAGFTLKDYGRAALVFESTHSKNLEEFIFRWIDVWKQTKENADEPMMNLLCSYQENMWRIILFPRKKHRPEFYNRKGNDRLLISPGLVDMAGLFIAPRQTDFDRMDAALVQSIYAEVSEDDGVVEQIIQRLKA